MPQRVSASFVNLVHEATLRPFWRRNTLWRFLRQQGIAEAFLSTWDTSETKRNFLDRLFSKLPSLTGGHGRILALARDLAQQGSFPDLIGYENSDVMLEQARSSVRALRIALEALDSQAASDRERQEAQQRMRQLHEEAARTRASLDSLSQRLNALAQALGTQQAGYDFQPWFFDLMEHFEVLHRRPYSVAGRQIDGSVTISGTTYLVELKFTADQAPAPEVDTFYKKVTDKADNTMGIMVSISGFSSVAIQTASGPRTPLLLLDHNHIYLALSGTATFPEIVDRVRRHASQTGDAFLPASAFHQ